MRNGYVNLFDHPLNSGDTFPEIFAQFLRDLFAMIVFCSFVYLLMCIMFCLQVGTEYMGVYVPTWHWPIKLVTLW